MDTQHFRLIFKRSQSDTAPPTFSLLVVADMSPAFVETARHYGRWNDIVYADPKLKEARDLRAAEAEAEARARQRPRKHGWWQQSLDNPIILPTWLTFQTFKMLSLGPIKLVWWMWCAIWTQRSQILRLRELQTGKIIAARTLIEIKQAEDDIRLATEEIEAYLREAASYEGRAFEPERTRS